MLINEMLEHSRSKTISRALKSMITSPSSFASMRFPVHLESTPFNKGTKPDDPPKNMDKPYHSDSINVITNLDVTCSLNSSYDHLLHLYSPNHSSEPQDTSSVESVEIEFIHESEDLWKIKVFTNRCFPWKP